MEPVGVKDASYVEPFLFFSYHTWALVSQRSVSCFLPFSHSPSAGWNGGFLVDLATYEIWPRRMKYLSGVRLLIVLSSAHVMGGTWVWIVHSYAFCKEPMPGSEESQPTDGAACFWCHCMWGQHPTISSLEAAELTQSLGTQMLLQVSDQHFPPQNLRVCNGLLILYFALFW